MLIADRLGAHGFNVLTAANTRGMIPSWPRNEWI